LARDLWKHPFIEINKKQSQSQSNNQTIKQPNKLKIMKPSKPFIVGILGLAVSAAVGQAQLSLNFSSSPGSSIQFNGSADTFQFNPSTFTGFGGVYLGTQWFVGSETGGTGSALGLFGSSGTSVFSYGPITVNGPLQSAAILGPLGTLDINDGSGFDLTGNINWEQIQTSAFAGALNAALVVNVTGLSYAGTNPDLLTLLASGVGQMDLSFQFSPGETLTQLSTGESPFSTSYAGSISPAPEPTSVGLLAVGLGVLILVRAFRKAQVKSVDQV
jgi:hypothetical protein